MFDLWPIKMQVVIVPYLAERVGCPVLGRLLENHCCPNRNVKLCVLGLCVQTFSR
jgi:hypothetical protein